MIREVKPFDGKQWSQLQKDMQTGLTEEQIQKITAARRCVPKISDEFLDF